MNRTHAGRTRLPGRTTILAILATVGGASAALAVPLSSAHAVGAGTYAYVTTLDGAADHNPVAIVDIADGTVAAQVPVGAFPQASVVSPDGKRVYVIDYYGGTVSVVDSTSEAVLDTIQLPGVSSLQDVALSPDGRTLYVIDTDQAQLFVIDTTTNAVTATVTVGPYPTSVVASANAVYTAGSGDVTVVSTATDQVTATIPVGGEGGQLALVPGSNLLYVDGEFGDSVALVDTSTNTVLRTLTDMPGTLDVAVSPDGSRTYVTTAANGIYELDSASSTVLANATTSQLGVGGSSLRAVTVAPDGRVYLGADNPVGGATLLAVDPSTLAPLASTPFANAISSVSVGTIAPSTSGKADVQTTLAGPRSGVTRTGYTYTETVKNAGPGTASHVAATMVLPRGASLVSASGSYERVGDLVVWRTVPRMAANATATYTVTVKFTGRGTKQLYAAAGSWTTPDPELGNNLAVFTTAIR